VKPLRLISLRRWAACVAAAALLALVGAVGVVGVAHAQEVKPEKSPALQCLQLLPGENTELVYPFDAFKRGDEGRVLVELEFTVAIGRPRVTVVEQQGDRTFVEAVRDHVRNLRVPCLTDADVPVRLRQDYVFKPAKATPKASTTDLADAERKAQANCVKHHKGKATPDYPASAERRGEVGRVFVRLSFSASDQAPELEVLAHEPDEALARSVRQFAEGLRMPCYAGTPVKTTMQFVFNLDGNREYGFKPLTLLGFLSGVKGIREQTIRYDFNTMACPFEVELIYLQPHSRNSVYEMGDAVAQRQPFLDWLRQVELDLPARNLAAVYADRALISVPCATFDIKPKAGS
jgi:hypothetical protein